MPHAEKSVNFNRFMILLNINYLNYFRGNLSNYFVVA